jgi:hypothetical protein
MFQPVAVPSGSWSAAATASLRVSMQAITWGVAAEALLLGPKQQ